MGVFDKFKSVVVTEYRADTKPMRAELKKLSGEQLKRHKALIDQTEAENAKLDSHIAMWGKVAIGIGAATAAYAIASKGFETYQHNSKLAAATVGVDLKGLQSSTNGLVESTRLLEFASSAMNGTFKLTQYEMEGALRGALALRKEGKDLGTTLDRLEQSIREGSTEPLKELGIVVKGAPNDTQEGLNAALAALNDEAVKMGDTGLAGDDMQRSLVKGADAFDNMANSVGKLATAFGPVIDAMATVLNKIADLPDWASDILSGTSGSEWHQTTQEGAIRDAIKRKQALLDNPMGFSLLDSGGKSKAEIKKDIDILRSQLQGELARVAMELANGNGTEFGPSADLMTKASRASNSNRKKGGGNPYTFGGLQLDSIGGDAMAAGYTGRNSTGHAAIANENASVQQALFEASKSMQGLDSAMKQLETWREEMARMEAQRIPNILAGVFGTPNEIDATTEALNVLAVSFDSLAGAFGAGVDALITGSSSFADAFNHAIAESLRGMAVDMSIRALREGALALGDLAFGNLPGAALHGQAAAAYAGGALAAGVAASAMGAGGSLPAPRTAGSAGVGTSTTPSNDNSGKGSTQVFIVGNDFAGLPARQRESQWRQISRAAGVSVEGDVVLDG